ncbi:MAG TPA: XRE family transcriptional regulator [Steroidobacteraceae bacterium]|nr:XRE family transcriptional regulator [Steroidobacteraceae bacterium]
MPAKRRTAAVSARAPDEEQQSMEQRIASGIKHRRETLSLSVNDLALRSGVSRAMISKIERVEASPTAALLGRLCNALGITLSSLIASAEATPSLPLSKAKDQLSWRDPETGLRRTMVSPMNTGSRVEIAQLELPPNTSVSYEGQQVAQYEQHILVLEGTLSLTTGGQQVELGAGDCLYQQVGPALRFANEARRVCRYLVVICR